MALLHLGGVGLFALAILDGSPIPTLGGPDLLTAILAARHREPWYYYALIATVGGVIGSFITYSIGHKAGEAYLARKFGERRVHRILEVVRQWGGSTLIGATLLPPPFPATIVFGVAGTLSYPKRRFAAMVAGGRAIRYSLLAWAADHYGRHFVRVVRHPDRYVGWIVLLAGIVIAAIAATFLMQRWVTQGAPMEQPHTQAQ